MSWSTERKEPYTERGIARMKCIRCQSPAFATWQICADRNRFRPLCRACDVALNRLVLEWAGHPDADGLMREYVAKAAL